MGLRNKVIFPLLVVLITISSSFCAYSNTHISQEDERKIRETSESFIKTDFSSLRGSNDFSTLGNDKFKEYLRARNDIKRVYAELIRSDSQTEKLDYKFKFIEISRLGKYVKVDLDTSEIGLVSYAGKKVSTKSGRTNHSIIYLAKIGDQYKVMSARMDTEADLIDDEFNANKELGFENGFADNDSLTSKNLKRMLKAMEERKVRLLDYYKKRGI
ncbi:MAG: hypothetical protein HXL17_03145 [Peptostreptococcus sp.]|uniref:hypothetical protein n=1 Tax=Peptostreptococcus sp. TaxID=1262 RepID=UPI001CAEC260|nr:hypothetical protein [Peptostreptococcus sp.]MBF1057085.1 hypothetical protein [Peptostreptococcus sp.]